MGRKGNLTLSASAPLPSWHSSAPGNNIPAFNFGGGGNKDCTKFSMFCLFGGLLKEPGRGFYFAPLEALTKPAYFGCLGDAENKGKWWVICCGQHSSAQLGGDTQLKASSSGGRETSGIFISILTFHQAA